MEGFSLFNKDSGQIMSNPNTSYSGSGAGLVSGLGFTEAPDVSGMTYNDAVGLLIDNGFEWVTFNIPTATQDDHNIVQSYVNDGVIYLNVYKYDVALEVYVTVPNLVGMTQSEATAALEAVGLSASFSTSTSGATSGNNGKVKSQSPTSGEQAEAGTSVSVVKYNYVVAANTISGNISGIRWAWHGDVSGNYAMFIRGQVFAGTTGSTITISGTGTAMDGNHTVVSVNADNSFDTGGSRIMITKDSAPTGISSTVTGTWALA